MPMVANSLPLYIITLPYYYSTDSSFSSSLIISEDYSEEWDEDNVAVHTKSISKKASRKKDYRSTQHTFDQSGNESSL